MKSANPYAPGDATFCYDSCKARPGGCDKRDCDWTTCVDDVAWIKYLLHRRLTKDFCVNEAGLGACTAVLNAVGLIALGSKSGGVSTLEPGFTDFSFKLVSLYHYDEDRVYATGFSNGGMFAYNLGVAMGAQLAAVVPIAGSWHRGFLQVGLCHLSLTLFCSKKTRFN